MNTCSYINISNIDYNLYFVKLKFVIRSRIYSSKACKDTVQITGSNIVNQLLAIDMVQC